MNFIKQYIMTILAIAIYVFVLITSFFHTVFFLSSFEPRTEYWIAIFIAIALDVSLFYFVFAEARQKALNMKPKDTKIAYMFLTIIVFLANWISMAYYFDPNKYPWMIFGWHISSLFPLIASIYIPFTTVYLARVGAQFLNVNKKVGMHKKVSKRLFDKVISDFIRRMLEKAPDLTITELQTLCKQELGQRIGKKTIVRIKNEIKRNQN